MRVKLSTIDVPYDLHKAKNLVDLGSIFYTKNERKKKKKDIIRNRPRLQVVLNP